MIISTTRDKKWQNGKEAKGGIKLEFGEAKQKIRGFGTCFSELGAQALNHLDPKEKEKFLDELFSKDGCNFNYCRTITKNISY